MSKLSPVLSTHTYDPIVLKVTVDLAAIVVTLV